MDIGSIFLLATLGLLTFFVAVVSARSVWILRRVAEAIPLVKPKGRLPSVSIIVPARNEELGIERCIRSLCEQEYPNFEVIAVNDNSEDRTKDILEGLAKEFSRLTVINAAPLAAGWTGKSWAVHQGVEKSRCDWLLFTDADTLHNSVMLASTMAYARRVGADLLSLFGFQETISFWERTIQPVVYQIFSLGNPVPMVNDPSRPRVAMARGEFILIKRDAYRSTGGHHALAGRVDEDFELARRVKMAGYRIHIADGRGLVRTRMYRGFGEIWNGWSKNIFLAAGESGWLIGGAIAFVALYTVLPFVLLIVGAFGAIVDPASKNWTLIGLVGLTQVLFVLGARRRIDQLCEIPHWFGVWHPLGGVLFAGILLNSAVRHMSGRGVSWKGRVYDQEGAM